MLFSGYPLRPEIARLHRKKYDFSRVSEPAHYYYDFYAADKQQQQHHLDVHAVEFVPKNDSGDSGNGSSSSEEESSSGSEAGE